ncbi:hypothetical protein GGX14DRAFT_390972 [Mycena pura]|uniref:Uncharacterized protein n=1 Tax=Mycena pura TaxID=153505 RepID=A0AAD6VM71_9AGAR|nr:hypothetical protein GGX14DRAFT_390972 [Mycena pura]
MPSKALPSGLSFKKKKSSKPPHPDTGTTSKSFLKTSAELNSGRPEPVSSSITTSNPEPTRELVLPSKPLPSGLSFKKNKGSKPPHADGPATNSNSSLKELSSAERRGARSSLTVELHFRSVALPECLSTPDSYQGLSSAERRGARSFFTVELHFRSVALAERLPKPDSYQELSSAERRGARSSLMVELRPGVAALAKCLPPCSENVRVSAPFYSSGSTGGPSSTQLKGAPKSFLFSVRRLFYRAPSPEPSSSQDSAATSKSRVRIERCKGVQQDGGGASRL